MTHFQYNIKTLQSSTLYDPSTGMVYQHDDLTIVAEPTPENYDKYVDTIIELIERFHQQHTTVDGVEKVGENTQKIHGFIPETKEINCKWFSRFQLKNKYDPIPKTLGETLLDIIDLGGHLSTDRWQSSEYCYHLYTESEGDKLYEVRLLGLADVQTSTVANDDRLNYTVGIKARHTHTEDSENSVQVKYMRTYAREEVDKIISE